MKIEMNLIEVSCARCGVSFLFSEALNRRFRNDHTSFCCPYGHTQSYPRPDILKKPENKKKKK